MCDPSGIKKEETLSNFSEQSENQHREINSREPSASSSTCQLLAMLGETTPETLIHELTTLLQCPICYELILLPIMQWQFGYFQCPNCRSNLSCCFACVETIGNIEDVLNLAIENKTISHERICEYLPFCCTSLGTTCSWQGSLDNVLDHLQNSHRTIEMYGGNNIFLMFTDINLAGDIYWATIHSCFNHYFLLHLKKRNTEFFAIVQLIGSPQQTGQFKYKLELNRKSIQLIWENIPLSCCERVTEDIMALHGLQFSSSKAQNLAEDGILKINLIISQVPMQTHF